MVAVGVLWRVGAAKSRTFVCARVSLICETAVVSGPRFVAASRRDFRQRTRGWVGNSQAKRRADPHPRAPERRQFTHRIAVAKFDGERDILPVDTGGWQRHDVLITYAEPH